jgi:tetratricopeptide (TPR) repeat protein
MMGWRGCKANVNSSFLHVRCGWCVYFAFVQVESCRKVRFFVERPVQKFGIQDEKGGMSLLRVLFLPWSLQPDALDDPHKERLGAYARQVPRYLSLRLEEVTYDVQTVFAPFCEEEVENVMFVVGTHRTEPDELREVGLQYEADWVISGYDLVFAADGAQVVLQTVEVQTGRLGEREIRSWPLDVERWLTELLGSTLEECRLSAEAELACTDLSPVFAAVSAFLCGVDRLMASEIEGMNVDPCEVFELFFEGFKHDPSWADGLELLVAAALDYAHEGEEYLALSLHAMERLILLHSDWYKAWEGLGMLYGLAQRGEDALYCLEQALTLAPESFGAYLTLGGWYRRTGRLLEAETILRTGLAANPDDVLLMIDLAETLGAQGRDAEAVPLFEQALRLAPHAGPIHAALGTALIRSGRAAEGEAVLQEGLRTTKPHRLLYQSLGNWLAAQGRNVDWLHLCFQGMRALREADEQAELADQLAERATGWLTGGMPEDVGQKGSLWMVGLLESVAELLPDHRLTWQALAAWNARCGRESQAAACREKAERLRDGSDEQAKEEQHGA